jgi:hypothetical protein
MDINQERKYDAVDGKIVNRATGKPIPDDEPIVIFRAKDKLAVLAHKVGRILNGDPEYKDSWHDIIGYTKLVEDTLSD